MKPANRAICLGEILVNCFSDRPGLSRSEVDRWTSLPGGMAANVAIAIAKLGNPVDFIGAISQDRWGKALIELLDDMSVGHSGVQRRSKAPTRKVYTTLNADGEPTFAGFSENPTVFADAHLFADALDPTLFSNASFLVLSTLPLAYPDSRQALERAVAIAKEKNVSTLVDINWRPMFWTQPAEAPTLIYSLIKKAQYLKVSGDEAEWLFATQSARAIAQQFPQLQGVLVIFAEQGVDYWLRGNTDSIPSFSVDVEDPAGAREAFTAGFIHQLLQTGDLCLEDPEVARQVVTYASAVSALTTTRAGAIAALPTPTEVDVFLYLNHYGQRNRT